MQTDSSRQSSSRFRQVQSTELQKHGDKREQIRQTADRAATDSDRCIAQNYKKHGDELEQIRQTADRAATDSGRQQPNSRFRQQIQIQADRADECMQTEPSQQYPGNRNHSILKPIQYQSNPVQIPNTDTNTDLNTNTNTKPPTPIILPIPILIPIRIQMPIS
ncbi:hypothetical protein Tco_1384695 [Tanacetum coccineum]